LLLKIRKKMLTKLSQKILIAGFLVICLPTALLAGKGDEFRWSELQWDEWSRDNVVSMYAGFKAYNIFMTAVEFKIFPTLGTQRLSATQLARSLNTDIAFTEFLLNSLARMGFLDKKDNLFANTKRTSDLFCSKSKNRDMQLEYMVDDWKRSPSTAVQLLKSGKSALALQISKENICYSFPYSWRATLYWYAFKNDADSIISSVDCSNVNTVLDLGGGCGYYSIELAHHYPRLKVTLFEINDYFLEIAKESINQHNLKDRIILKQGDFLKDDFGGKYDMILIFNVIHLFSEKYNLQLLKKAKESLNKGGKIVIHDSFLNVPKTNSGNNSDPWYHTLDSSILMFGSELVSPRPYLEVENWLVFLGFKNIKKINKLGLIIGEY